MSPRLRCCLITMLLLVLSRVPAWSEVTGVIYPAATWQTRDAAKVHLVDANLDAFIKNVGGDGCIVKDGYLIRAWGEYKAPGDWFSASKPVLGTLLMLAVAEKRLPSVDAPVQLAGWEFKPPDHGITFRQLANMVSGYARSEPPGAAWAYNDIAVNLYAQSLKRVFGTDLNAAFHERLAALQFEDGPFFGSRESLSVQASPRDFARLGWFWLHRGVWKGHTVIPRKLFGHCVRPGVPEDLPRTSAPGDDYLDVGSYGSGTDQVEFGPGLYGFSFWFNRKVPGTKHHLWPSLPRTTFQANGIWNKHTVTVIRDWRMVVVVRNGLMGRYEPDSPDSKTDRKFALLRPTHSEVLRRAQTQVD